ncbi:MAG: BON domain-containing protein [Acidobacteriota bacterium]
MKRVAIHWEQLLLVIMVMSLAACTQAPAPSDDNLGNSVKASLFSDPELKSEAIDVVVNEGEVTLSGTVSNPERRRRAYNAASAVPGVTKVNDLMQVSEAAASSGASGRPSSSRGVAGTSPGPSSPGPSSPVSSTAARTVAIPSGTPVRVQMIDSVNSDKDRIGQSFAASLAEPLSVGGKVVVPQGADVTVKLVDAKQSGTFQGRSELRLELDQLSYGGKNYTLNSSTYEVVGKSRGKDTATKTAIGAGVGAAIGAIAGGGKGAAIGAGVGAGGGAASQIFLKGKQVQVPSETKLDFTLDAPVEIEQR